MKSESSRLEGIRKAACNLPLLLYQCLRRDILACVVPCSLVLEKVSLLLSEAITTIETPYTQFPNWLNCLRRWCLLHGFVSYDQ